MAIWPKAWTSRTLLWIATVFVVYSAGTHFGAPPLLRYILTKQANIALHRPVSVGEITFNPYRLRLIAVDLRVGERSEPSDFFAIGRLNLRLSWTSLFRLALVVKEVTIDHVSLHLTRITPETFNFSDLMQRASASPQTPSKPLYFAVSNIQLNDGQILFDDRVLRQLHRADKIRLNLPFIANLPTDVDNYVEPLLQMTVDGSRFAVTGRTKPFGNTRESVLNLGIHHLDLTQYIGYLPVKLQAELVSAILSTALQVSFVETSDKPQLHIGGIVGLDDVVVRDIASAPLVEMKAFQVAVADVEPLNSVVHLSSITIDALTPHLVLNHDRSTNFTSILNAKQPNQSLTRPSANGASIGAVPALSSLTPKAVSLSATSAASLPNRPLVSAAPAANPSKPLGISGSIVMETPRAGGPPSPTSSIVASAPIASSPSLGSINARTGSNALHLLIDSIQLSNSAVEVRDLTGAVPGQLKLQAIRASVTNFASPAMTPASYDMSASLASGGQITAAGSLRLLQAQANVQLGLKQIELPALQGLAQSVLAGLIASGTLSASASLNVSFAPGRFDLSVQPSEVAIDDFAVRAPNGQEEPLRWRHLDLKLANFDLASGDVTVKEVRSDAMQIRAERDRRGNLNLLSLIHTQPEVGARLARRARRRLERYRLAQSERRASLRSRPPKGPPRVGAVPETVAQPATPWHFKVESVAMENSEASLMEHAGRQAVTIGVSPLNIDLKNISDDFATPIGIELNGRVNRKGTFKIIGNAAIQPFKAQLRIETRRLDLASLDPYITGKLNARIERVELTMKGEARAAMGLKRIEASYRGDLALGNVRLLDKLTREHFLNWYALQFDHVDLRYGQDEPKMHVGAIALTNFYSRVILNSDAQLNLRDVMTNPQKAPVSLTHAHGEVGVAPSPSASPSRAPGSAVTQASASPAPAPSPIPADIAIGGITLRGGQIDYTDNFIEPNYSMDLTNMEGKIGGFGTDNSRPAAVRLSGQVNGSSPIGINGLIDPLTPLASVDLKANANGIELAPLAPYTTKYTGYPIVEGTLTVDVHYLLANQQLTAKNHIVLDELTFGDRVANSTARNLPIRLAVALLKDSNGRIDLSIPVSGSLSDPQFSLGGLIWKALVNLVMKAVTAPFSLIASVAGGSNQNLSYIEFAPGYATLTSEATNKLNIVAKALQQKGSLTLVITGAADPRLDRDGLREATLDYAIRRQKAGKDAGENDVDLDQVKVTPDEYNKYLRRVYKAADFEKPKGYVGMIKSLPPDEMKKLILANTKITDAELLRLAQARAEAVRRQLSGKIQPQRLQTLAPKLDGNGTGPKAPTTVVNLSLR